MPPPLVEIGLTDQSKTGEAEASAGPPACDSPDSGVRAHMSRVSNCHFNDKLYFAILKWSYFTFFQVFALYVCHPTCEICFHRLSETEYN